MFGYGKNNFVKKIIKNLISHDHVSVVTDEFSSPTSSIDLVNLIKYIITEKKIKYGLYHFNFIYICNNTYIFINYYKQFFKHKK